MVATETIEAIWVTIMKEVLGMVVGKGRDQAVGTEMITETAEGHLEAAETGETAEEVSNFPPLSNHLFISYTNDSQSVENRNM